MAIATATQKREKGEREGTGERERREEGQCTAQKSGRDVRTKGRPNERSAKGWGEGRQEGRRAGGKRTSYTGELRIRVGETG
jgi:hypothetical protein